MALNIKNTQVETLAAEVARITGETKTEAIRKALLERKRRLALATQPADRPELALRFLEGEIWPHIPPDQQGKPLTPHQWDEILGLGAHGV